MQHLFQANEKMLAFLTERSLKSSSTRNSLCHLSRRPVMSLEAFKVRLDRALSSLTWWELGGHSGP